jgi:hypothetical protein
MKVLTMLLFATTLILMTSGSVADEVAIETTGEELILDIQPEDTFLGVLESISLCFDIPDAEADENDLQLLNSAQKQFTMDVFVAGSKISKVVAKQPKNIPRNYWAFVTPVEKGHVKFILETLAMEPWYKIIANKRALEDAGEQVDHLHPFKWLLCIFSDPQLLGYIHMIFNSKGFPLKGFYDGTTKSLEREHSFNNLKPEYIQDLANHLHINPKALTPSLKDRDWKGFVKAVYKEVPWEGGSDKYNP